MSTTVLVSTFPPFPTLALAAPSDTTLEDLHDVLLTRYPFLPLTADLRLSPVSGAVPEETATLVSILGLHDADQSLLSLRLVPRMRGGKGGFGSQLRAAGGRMSSQKTSNNDSCRDLSGRRLSTIKEAKRLAEYLEQEPARKKAAAEAQRAKLEALERKLGIDKDAGPSSNGEPAQVAGKKHRFDDTEYLEQSRELVDNVKSAVAAGLLKKRKKAKTGTSPSGSGSTELKAPAQEPSVPVAPAVPAEPLAQDVSVAAITAVGA
ncbi:telomere stability and silencing-domain-containing protein [Gloeopeniophorella convolvens]|nr:telomere stability and silencing-domain-containing protein [Gloeopeniophorella convolvens]